MRLIDADALEHDLVTVARYLKKDQVLDVAYRINKAPAVDVVYCAECAHSFGVTGEDGKRLLLCTEVGRRGLRDDDFCSYGRRQPRDNS